MIDKLIEAIRAAVAEGASAEARAAGANACRTLLGALDPQPTDSIASGPQVPPQPPSLPIGAIVAAIRGMPTDQLADVLIAKLRTLVPTDAATQVPTVRLSIPQVKVPRL